MPKKNSQQSPIELCHKQLQNLIVSGTLPAGTLLEMPPLKKELSATQDSIEKVLSMLVCQRLVETKNYQEFYVTPITKAYIQDAYNSFLAVEMATVEQSIAHGDRAWRERIKKSFDALTPFLNVQKESFSSSLWATCNYNFHESLVAACPWPTLLHIRQNLWYQTDRYLRCAVDMASSPEIFAQKHNEHIQITQAVLNRDVKEAVALMTFHIMDNMRIILERLKLNNI